MSHPKASRHQPGDTPSLELSCGLHPKARPGDTSPRGGTWNQGAGEYNPAEDSEPLGPRPPDTSTRPEPTSVTTPALVSAVGNVPALCHWPLAGSYTSAEANKPTVPPPSPPNTNTRPEGSSEDIGP